ncbi:MAG: hypothetical protein ABJD75_15195 [Parasphingorhabdus sp.]|uniref:hypothetical protein n=1 Tax=Parasphingorhabdus sp. TaxID=2709688 RepID=UPI003266F248
MSSGVAFFCDGWHMPAMPKPQSRSEKQRKEAAKAERLAVQLRANLRRRKAQAKDLNSGTPISESDG